MERSIVSILPLVFGYLLDLFLGDPHSWPHPVKFFGSMISGSDKLLNEGRYRFLKGMVISVVLCVLSFLFFYLLMKALLDFDSVAYIAIGSIFVFFGLANKSLITEGEKVFDVLNTNGLEAGRKRLSWIVGRDTSGLTVQQIRIAVFETMSENLSDGVIAPLFYYMVGGIPGLMTYKMINTLDSMIGYRNNQYEQFGKFAARLDDVANFIPARLTALLMVIACRSGRGMKFILKYGEKHKSPNSGYPEAALAGIIDARFGGPNVYHGILVQKPFIGDNSRNIVHSELKKVSQINHKTTFLMITIVALILYAVN